MPPENLPDLANSRRGFRPWRAFWRGRVSKSFSDLVEEPGGCARSLVLKSIVELTQQSIQGSEFRPTRCSLFRI
jgi:hypothetical protein